MGRRRRAAASGQLMKTLTDAGFNSTIRAVRTKDIEKVNQILTLAESALERTGHKADPSKAVKSTPQGSDQLDVGTLVTWAGKIGRRDRSAVRQLIAIHATAVDRLA